MPLSTRFISQWILSSLVLENFPGRTSHERLWWYLNCLWNLSCQLVNWVKLFIHRWRGNGRLVSGMMDFWSNKPVFAALQMCVQEAESCLAQKLCVLPPSHLQLNSYLCAPSSFKGFWWVQRYAPGQYQSPLTRAAVPFTRLGHPSCICHFFPRITFLLLRTQQWPPACKHRH